jgi:hypothetical protein
MTLLLPGLRAGLAYAVCALLLAALCTGCRTTPKIDWNSRIGNYTYDQAVLELGPPDKMAVLTDKTKVAEWMTFRGREGAYVPAFGPHLYHPYFYGPPLYYSEPPSPDRLLRLTFDPQNRLVRWSSRYR